MMFTVNCASHVLTDMLLQKVGFLKQAQYVAEGTPKKKKEKMVLIAKYNELVISCPSTRKKLFLFLRQL